MTSLGREERAPQPWGWELPVGCAVCWVLVAVLLVPAGQGVASVAAGSGWCWPTSAGLFLAIGGLLSGHAGRGLAPAAAAGLPATWVVYTLIVAAELTLVAVTAGGVWLWQREFADTRGWATRRDATEALGVDRLHRRRTELRPDLYPPRRSKATR